MIAEFASAVGAIKNVIEIFRNSGSKDSDRDISQLKQALEKLLAGIDKSESQSRRIAELEAEVRKLKEFEGEKAGYQLAEIGPGVFAYVSKPSGHINQPVHSLCAHCFGQRKKSILQLHFWGEGGKTYRCHACNSVIKIESGHDLPDG